MIHDNNEMIIFTYVNFSDWYSVEFFKIYTTIYVDLKSFDIGRFYLGEKWLGNRGVIFGIGLGVGFRTFGD